MAFIQFRIHPAVGCARMGNSKAAYYLASEFPYFLQEEFSNLRFAPKLRTHPLSPAGVAAGASSAALASFSVDDLTSAYQNKFKEAAGKIFPQAARFRVFAYVYDDEKSSHTSNVFEVTTDLADITWKVNIANKKSQKTGVAGPDANLTVATTDLSTTATGLVCKQIRPKSTMPTLGYILLERDPADKLKVNGRLHVIGNEGDLVGSSEPTSLWSNDWYDSAGDGPVQAVITPKGGGGLLRAAAGASSVADLKYLDYGTNDAQAGSATTINAVPAWVVVACPDYTPDMGHFVSLWDMAFSRALVHIETSRPRTQPGKHKLVTTRSDTEIYKGFDYFIHIHPQLCLFDDVKYVSGEAHGKPDSTPPPASASTTPPVRGHNTPLGVTAAASATTDQKVEHGGVSINARNNKAAFADPKQLKDEGPTKSLSDGLKIAVFKRLRKPGTLYDVARRFHTSPPGGTPGTSQREVGLFPRKLGRRMHYGVLGPDGLPSGLNGKDYGFPETEEHGRNLRRFHDRLEGSPGSFCGKTPLPPTERSPPSLATADAARIELLDDMYWPATAADMPLLRELAYTPQQYMQFKIWQSSPDEEDPRDVNILDKIVGSLKGLFNAAVDQNGNPVDADGHFAQLVRLNPKYAPAMIDMAHLGSMLGGSFLPGIEVGREAGISNNWSLFHGATTLFPSIRFKLADDDAEHTPGTLTKDLSVPWTDDFSKCDETYWPTARPGQVTTQTMIAADSATRHRWMLFWKSTPQPSGPPIITGDSIFTPRRIPTSRAEFVKEYWKELGFIRRDATDRFTEEEQNWH
jgi:hypothetical protein